MKKEIYCSFQIEGVHYWADCPFEEVDYLRHRHRHQFGIKAYKQVTHSDRDIEFIVLKHQMLAYLHKTYYNDVSKLHWFGGKSCEMLAEELITAFELTRCEVNEDGENGAIVYADIATNDSISPLSKYPSWYNDAEYQETMKKLSSPYVEGEEESE